MIEIKEVEKNGIAQRMGIKKGESLFSINGHGIRDEIDLSYYGSDGLLVVEVGDEEQKRSVRIEKLPEERLGISLEPFDFRRCQNRCIFCFFDQMPNGLRKSLYEKDDDYRLSFLFGNYITLSNMDEGDFERIGEQRLSPLYVSVHSTDPEIRSRLLGRESGNCDIMVQLQKLVDRKIEVHTQIVLCPGINDGRKLEKTVKDLAQFFPFVRSVSVIPVGITRYRDDLPPLRTLTKGECLEVIEKVLLWNDTFRKKFDVGFVYPSDEILIKGEFLIPMKEFYDNFPQLENGVGMSRIFLDEIDSFEMDDFDGIEGSVILVTSILPYPWLNMLRKRIVLESSLFCDVLCVRNIFFGDTVTVSGLLVGKDIRNAIQSCEEDADLFIVPGNCVNSDGHFLDDMSLADLNRQTGKRIVTSSQSLDELSHSIKRELRR
jgi:putative radical SAM enzyme (TIGR03279 family)